MRGKLPYIHERFLRHIWSKQYLRAAPLRTTDGSPVRVLLPGDLNDDEGPDFLNAKVRIGSTMFAGDVEMHRTVAEWIRHHHDNDARYNRVVLHVVLEGDEGIPPTISQSGRTIPTLVLEPFLPEAIHTIWKQTVLDEQSRRHPAIKCSDRNGEVGSDVLRGWLTKLARERLELKVRRFDERLRQLAQEHRMRVQEPWRSWRRLSREGYPHEIPPPLGELGTHDLTSRELWDQILYEGMMEGLGYAKNREPFHRLARSLTISRLRSVVPSSDPAAVQSVLFGVAGLLPRIGALQDRTSRNYARILRRGWITAKSRLPIERLHAADWRFFPTRPANFPTVRLAAASVLIKRLIREDLFREIIQAMKSLETPGEHRVALHGLLRVEPDGFWGSHCNFDQPSRRVVTPLGASRIDDIIVNTILPIGLLYGRTFTDQAVREGVLALHDWYPSSGSNSITAIIGRQLLRGKVALDTMRLQQGSIQLYQYYCLEGRCAECEVGKRVFPKERDQPGKGFRSSVSSSSLPGREHY